MNNVFRVKIKVKVNIEHATKAQRGVAVYLYSFFNLGTRRGWVVNATPRPFYPLKRDPVPIIYEDVLAPVSGWKGAENLYVSGIRSPGSSSPQLVSIPTELSRLKCLACAVEFTTKNAYKIFVGKRKRVTLKCPTRRCVEWQTEIGAKEIWWGLELDLLAQHLTHWHATVSIAKKIGPQKGGKFPYYLGFL